MQITITITLEMNGCQLLAQVTLVQGFNDTSA